LPDGKDTALVGTFADFVSEAIITDEKPGTFGEAFTIASEFLKPSGHLQCALVIWLHWPPDDDEEAAGIPEEYSGSEHALVASQNGPATSISRKRQKPSDGGTSRAPKRRKLIRATS
jgi:hypothetical protein